jgi:hypothetical protein
MCFDGFLLHCKIVWVLLEFDTSMVLICLKSSKKDIHKRVGKRGSYNSLIICMKLMLN